MRYVGDGMRLNLSVGRVIRPSPPSAEHEALDRDPPGVADVPQC